MKIEISEDGVLYIERAGRMREQLCMYNHFTRCGHWCPLFGEPETTCECKAPNDVECPPRPLCNECPHEVNETRLEICGMRILSGQIEDKRGQK